MFIFSKLLCLEYSKAVPMPRKCDECMRNITENIYTEADPGFLERGLICIKVWGFALLILSHFSKISHENEIIWSH